MKLLLIFAFTLVATQALDPRERVPVPSTGLVPLTDLGTRMYHGFAGGLYPGGSNEMPAQHRLAGTNAARTVLPLDVNGRPDLVRGRIVLLSIGLSNTSQEFCDGTGPLTMCPCACSPSSFMGLAGIDPTVDTSHLVIVNGAMSGQAAMDWASATNRDYDLVRDNRLKPLGINELQVQAVWLKVANINPTTGLPAPDADAFVLKTRLGHDVRALRVRYPHLKMVFLASRTYAGYALGDLNPEPFAYESGFAVKWLIEAQIRQMATGEVDAQAGDLGYVTVAPWLAWGPYLWADGLRSRSDGLAWSADDFEGDGVHPGPAGRRKVGRLLLEFFKREPMTACWFVRGGRCS